jgi:phosphoribosylformimino-5-aminoimidazole carboxamide ribonucleotide (ProFAR) isomerase
VRAVLASGAARAVVGTAALRDPTFAGALVEEHGPERVAVAIDVRDGQAIGSGWVASSPGPDALDAIALLAEEGITTFEVTAIDRDGLLQGPDLDLFGRAVALDRGRIIASAGITSRKDVAAVRAIGCSGAIIGRALYEGQLSLQDALSAAESD